MSETINAAVAVTTETITATVITGSETITVDVNVAARGPEGGTSGGGASDVSQLTTTGLASLNMLRVKTAGGLEARTPAQVIADIGAATTAQGGLADSAVQPGDLATASVGTSAALVFGETVHAVSMSYIDDIATFTFGTAAAAGLRTAAYCVGSQPAGTHAALTRVTHHYACTQAQYDAIGTKDANTIYDIY